MKSNFIQETSIAAILIVLLLIILNPFKIWMPNMIHIMMLVAALVVFAAFATFVLREKTIDERDGIHKMFAGRLAFLAGSAVLIIGIILQEVHGSVDVWLIYTLVAMIVVKLMSRIYSDYNL
jgi:hypothetical protein